MTIEEAISEFWHGVTAYEVQNRNNITMDITDEARMMAIAALEQQNFTRWHDLRKNPEDLPAGTDSVLVCYQHLHPDLRCYECAYYEDGAWIDNAETWKNDVDFAGDWEVIAWRYVEQFEEFEE